MHIFNNAEVLSQYVNDLVNYSDESMCDFRFLSNDQSHLTSKTPEQAYSFYRDHLRPDDDSINFEENTRFVFVVVDTECIEADPWQCILCCDAPDFGEADEEPKLKQIRMPLREAVEYLCVLEQLAMTPSEVLNPDGWSLSMTPPATMMIQEKNRNRCEIATPAEARWNKKSGIMTVEAADEGQIRLYDAEIDRVLFRCPRAEAAFAASMHRNIELEVRTWSGRGNIRLIDNRTDEAVQEAKLKESSPNPSQFLRLS